MIHHVETIDVLPLFPKLHEKLISLLRSLSDEEWHKPTIAKQWLVRDIAAHMLDGNLRTLSALRDKYFTDRPENTDTYGGLLTYLNELNSRWVQVAKRLSPQVITDLLEVTGMQYYEFLTTLEPWDDALFPVAWAGEETSKNWFHIAREYTEQWLHQQQIRQAIGIHGIMTRELFYPFIDSCMCALPHTYHSVEAVTGTSIMVVITTDLGGEWHINKTEEGWVLRKETNVTPMVVVEIDPDTAWKLFSKGITPEEAREQIHISGSEDLGKVVLNMKCFMV